MTDAQAEMYSFWEEWFAQPEEEKRKHLRQSGKGGWYPPGSESPGYEAKADPKEYFHWRLTQAHPFGDDETEEIFWACYDKANDWLNERGLHNVMKAVEAEDCVLRIIKYPATPDGNVGQAHCDFDLLTVSVPGTVPGLEVWGETHGGAPYWEPRETFEVHVGEMLTHYAKIPATPHRVRVQPNTERYKAVFFYLPPMDFELRPGFTARDYLLGPNGVLNKAGTAKVGE